MRRSVGARYRWLCGLMATAATCALLATLGTPAVGATSADATWAVAHTLADRFPDDDPGLWVAPRCAGDGNTGKRLQLVYVYSQDMPSNLPVIRDRLLKSAAFTTGVYEHSSDGTRSPRWATDSTCTPTIIEAAAPQDVMGHYESARAFLERSSRQFRKTDRVYAVYLDFDPAGNWAGLGGARWAFVWRDFEQALAHEITHALGAVSDSAPHSTGAGHCWDDGELMCYDDGGPRSELVEMCPGDIQRYLLDCGRDDYFSTSPQPGSWLAAHPRSNVANSPYLAKTQPQRWPAATTAPLLTQVTRTDDGTLTLAWTAAGPVDIYGYSGSGTWETIALGVVQSPLKLPNPQGTYYVQVRQVSVWGYSSWAESYVGT